jgi:hypothetical protein
MPRRFGRQGLVMPQRQLSSIGLLAVKTLGV